MAHEVKRTRPAHLMPWSAVRADVDASAAADAGVAEAGVRLEDAPEHAVHLAQLLLLAEPDAYNLQMNRDQQERLENWPGTAAIRAQGQVSRD